MIIDLKTITTIELGLAAITKLEGMITETQKYVGQLERGEVPGKGISKTEDTEMARMKASMAERNMRDDKKDAETKLREDYGSEVFDILSLKYDKFSKESIRAEASTVQFFISCFELTFARDMRDKESDLFASYNKVVKPPVAAVPAPGADVPPQTGGDNPPPPITNSDPAGGIPAPGTPKKTENTGEAFNDLEKTLAGFTKNPYDK